MTKQIDELSSYHTHPDRKKEEPGVFISEKDNKWLSTVRRWFRSQPERYSALGRELKISPKAKVCINKPGYETRFHVPTVEILIGIGEDHHATLIMDEESWKSFKSGATLDIDTIQKFRKSVK